MKQSQAKLKRLLVWAVVILAMSAVFLAYLQPDMALALATQLWNCF